jgi:hypothetical protein
MSGYDFQRRSCSGHSSAPIPLKRTEETLGSAMRSKIILLKSKGS